jgi:chorismate mutase
MIKIRIQAVGERITRLCHRLELLHRRYKIAGTVQEIKNNNSPIRREAESEPPAVPHICDQRMPAHRSMSLGSCDEYDRGRLAY